MPRECRAGGSFHEVARHSKFAFTILAVCALAACAPGIVAPGPRVMTPTLEDSAVRVGDGVELPLHVWGDTTVAEPGAVVIALHGFNDYGNFFDNLGRYLAGRGVVSYAYDQRGFGAAPDPGEWAGADAYPDDLRDTVTAVRARYPHARLYVFGESMGGGVAMVAAGEPPGLPSME